MGGSGWGGWGQNEELKFWGKFTKKNGGGGGVGRGGGQVGGSGWWVGGDLGYGGCEPRIEGIVQCTKRYCTILRK